MITCDKKYLEARCRERGYTLEEVMGCVVAQDGDQWTIDRRSWCVAQSGDAALKAAHGLGGSGRWHGTQDS
jgi:hypothetical protein